MLIQDVGLTSTLNIEPWKVLWREGLMCVFSLYVCVHIKSLVFNEFAKCALQGTHVASLNNLLCHCCFCCRTVEEVEAPGHSPAKEEWGADSHPAFCSVTHADGETCSRGCFGPVCLKIVIFKRCATVIFKACNT